MWGESSKNCENNCQCSGLITESFRINSGNGASKRKQEEALTSNFKLKMNPHALDFKSPLSSPIVTPKRRILGEISNFSPINSPLQRLINIDRKTPLKSPLMDRNTQSPVTSRSFKRSTNKISRIFEERTRFKMSNKENEGSIINDTSLTSLENETFVKLDLGEEARDAFGDYHYKESLTKWSTAKLDFTDALQSTSFESKSKTHTDLFVPEKDMDTELDPEFETLHDLEEEFENENFEACTKYEIISTDSPNIISRGRSSTSRKVTSRNFVFGAPLADNEQTTSFNKPNITATRMLNFEDESFLFTSPAARKTNNMTVKKSLKFNETPTKSPLRLESLTKKPETPTRFPLRHERSDSSIGSMTSSPCSSHIRLFSSESTTSMESGFISELEEPFLELEGTSNSPKMPNFNDLLSGTIKENILTERSFLKRPLLQRSLSFNPECKVKVNDSPRRSQKREFGISENFSNKKRKASAPNLENKAENKENEIENIADNMEKPRRPVLQRAFSENHASIMSALSRSSSEPDLIGDFSQPYALPLVGGDHSDLKSISCDTLAALIRGEFAESVKEYQIIDCRYPYEFEGGHIPGALNLYNSKLVQQLLETPLEATSDHRRKILLFHCEFSIQRGPKLYRYLRSADRSKNAENYPHLTYPEIYLVHKGYRTFYQKYPELCTPVGYTAMLDPKHSHLLKRHRSTEEPNSFYTHHRKGHRLMY